MINSEILNIYSDEYDYLNGEDWLFLQSERRLQDFYRSSETQNSKDIECICESLKNCFQLINYLSDLPEEEAENLHHSVMDANNNTQIRTFDVNTNERNGTFIKESNSDLKYNTDVNGTFVKESTFIKYSKKANETFSKNIVSLNSTYDKSNSPKKPKEIKNFDVKSYVKDFNPLISTPCGTTKSTFADYLNYISPIEVSNNNFNKESNIFNSEGNTTFDRNLNATIEVSNKNPNIQVPDVSKSYLKEINIDEGKIMKIAKNATNKILRKGTFRIKEENIPENNTRDVNKNVPGKNFPGTSKLPGLRNTRTGIPKISSQPILRKISQPKPLTATYYPHNLKKNASGTIPKRSSRK